ncbi:hypothetical protein CEXT_811521 [Caerostris extrusa]|uniref:Uncharacterized protein n=1 Tax=Caerostris extrusa TaxID=172846 RepID=A0AAV4WU87_CAEEX|nr:hypothetical protein CEXT_811521 [Caerostris extrusa]
MISSSRCPVFFLEVQRKKVTLHSYRYLALLSMFAELTYYGMNVTDLKDIKAVFFVDKAILEKACDLNRRLDIIELTTASFFPTGLLAQLVHLHRRRRDSHSARVSGTLQRQEEEEEDLDAAEGPLREDTLRRLNYQADASLSPPEIPTQVQQFRNHARVQTLDEFAGRWLCTALGKISIILVHVS